jgi:hypothetical protein
MAGNFAKKLTVFARLSANVTEPVIFGLIWSAIAPAFDQLFQPYPPSLPSLGFAGVPLSGPPAANYEKFDSKFRPFTPT